MEFTETRLPGVVRIRPRVFGDPRGFFLETWERRKFAAGGVDVDFVQDNHSRSSRGILRGIHYQLQRPQGKLVRVVRGSVFDVAVDLRRSSPHFGEWVGVELSDSNHEMLWVPAGFGHGFMVTSDEADVVYKCTDFYFPEHERSLAWNDAQLGIEWPLAGMEPKLSERDRHAKAFRDADLFE